MTMTAQQLRTAIVAEAHWGINNQASIHYRMKRPMDSRDNWQQHRTPFDCDCSEADTDIYFAAGAPDPNGLGYNNLGNTQTIYDHGVHIKQSEAHVGDHVVYRRASGETVHVAIMIEAGSDPVLFSHGAETGPRAIRLTTESAYHASVTSEHPSPAYPVWVRTLPLVTPVAYKWRVADAMGNTIAETVLHPAIWATQHPLSFRKHGSVRFNRQVRN